MNDYSQYPYAGLLKYIDEGCKRLGEERDFVQYLISMNEVESIEEMINRYNNIYKLIAVIFFGTNKLPASWYNPKTWGYNHEYLVDELNLCLNKSILGWLKRQENPTTEMCRMCIANLRNNEKYISVENDFLKEYFDKDESLQILLGVQNDHYNLLKAFEDRFKEEFIHSSEFLAIKGRCFDIRELSVGEDYNIDYNNLLVQYNERIEKQKQEEENKVQEKKAKDKKEKIVIVVSLICVALLSYIVSFFSYPVALFILVLYPILLLIYYSCSGIKVKNQGTNMDVDADTIGDALGGLLVMFMGAFLFIAEALE